ncbi:hypothetical protein [Simplicispira lacusdiani]|uniref:hypothetical protein n=1 Tax=Simplicispira lacusdiani TaxID=2213010 RepID=UPI000E74A99F|nr:hypothetical protein [Simplicispira lacusdiani]
MLLVKTQAGLDSLKDRQGVLTQRQRSAFILFDGKRTAEQVLAATAAMGITQDDVQTMIDQGLLAPPPGAAGAAGAAVASAEPEASGTQGSGRSAQERYQEAYPIATELTADLGLRGFRLNLAIEGAGSFDQLAALAPKIREAVGDAKYARLDVALFG